MPAVVAVVTARDLKNPLPRAIPVLGRVGCGGLCCIGDRADAGLRRPSDETLCDLRRRCGMANLFNAMAPVIKGAAMLYILVGIPVAVIAHIIELVQNRGASPT